jgi:hypothetical protein
MRDDILGRGSEKLRWKVNIRGPEINIDRREINSIFRGVGLDEVSKTEDIEDH